MFLGFLPFAYAKDNNQNHLIIVISLLIKQRQHNVGYSKYYKEMCNKYNFYSSRRYQICIQIISEY